MNKNLQFHLNDTLFKGVNLHRYPWRRSRSGEPRSPFSRRREGDRSEGRC